VVAGAGVAVLVIAAAASEMLMLITTVVEVYREESLYDWPVIISRWSWDRWSYIFLLCNCS